MINTEIKHNMALEFIGFISRYSKNEEIHELVKEFDLKFNEDIEKWMEDINNEISPFLKSDIELLVGGLWISQYAMLQMVIENEIETPKEYISFFKGVSGEEYIKRCFDEYEMNKYDDNQITFESKDDDIFEAIKFRKDEEEAKNFKQFKKYSTEMKKRLDMVLEEFYNNFFIKYEEKIRKIMKEKVKLSNEKFKDDPETFLEVIGRGDFSNVLKGDRNLKIYVNYTTEFDFAYYIDSSICNIIYGYGMEQRFNQKKMREKSKDFFKALSDEKRLEILRLLGRRKWFSNELAKHFSLTSATMSYHINKLTDLGVVLHEAGDQNKVYYKINKEKLKELFEVALKDILGE
ncbi:MAG: winged helix-turn-helix transcriptional regulator [Firmicutes bacterium]|nr:winged helix-turn-helix transcriptional regulator [Bacillota bacterium]